MSRTTYFDQALGIFDQSLSFLFSTCCAFCERSDTSSYLCEECRAYYFLESPNCQKCGWPMPFSLESCGECEKKEYCYRARSFFWLTEPHHFVWKQIKFSGRSDLLRLYFPALQMPLVEVARDFSVCPIPLFWRDRLTRGFNQSEVIASALSKCWDLPLWNGLQKIKKTKPQSQLSERERYLNLKNIFQITSEAVPKKIYLVDDILTTGSTLQAASRFLLSSGAEEITAITLFRTPNRHAIIRNAHKFTSRFS